MEPLLAALADWVAAIGLDDWARSGASVYPAANTVHLLGLVMLVGGIGVVDLRMSGLIRSLPAEPLSRALTPIAVAGLLIAATSGLILFAADAPALVGSDTFQLKLLLVAAALANAVLFQLLFRRRLADWERAPAPLGRAMAGLSLLLWLAVATAGRLIAYI